jgi:hypothetical protein
VLYLLVVTDSPHAPTVNIDNTTARTLDDSLPGQLVNPRSRPATVLLSAADSRSAGAGARVCDLDAVEVVRPDRPRSDAISIDGLKIDRPAVPEIGHYRAFSAG